MGELTEDMKPFADLHRGPERRYLWVLLGLLCASLALRLAFATRWSQPLVNDAAHFNALAKTLLHHGRFPSAYRSPGYPAFVAMIYGVFGESPAAVFMVQAIVATAAVGLVYLLGVDLFGPERRRLALAAAALVGLNPEIAAYSGILLREAISVPLILLAAWLGVRMLTRSWQYGVLLGLSVIALAYVRTEGCLPVAVMIGAGLFHRCWRRRIVAGGLTAASVMMAGTLPWVLYCARSRGYVGMQHALAPCLFSRVWYLSPEGSVEPALRRYTMAAVARSGLTARETRRFTVPPLLVKGLARDDVRAEVALYDKLGRIAGENVIRCWPRYLADSADHFRALMGGYWLFWWKGYWEVPPLRGNLRDGQWGVAATKLINRVLWPMGVVLLTIVSLRCLWRQGDSAAWPVTLLLAGVAAGLTLVSLTVCGDPRLRLPYDGIFYLPVCHGFGVAVRPWTKITARSTIGEKMGLESPPKRVTAFEHPVRESIRSHVKGIVVKSKAT